MDAAMIAALRADAEKLGHLTGEDHTPQELITCEACDGSGEQLFATEVYEAGCHVSHLGTYSKPCPECDGAGVFLRDL
jgi:DnaJ-class molecular chaperone